MNWIGLIKAIVVFAFMLGMYLWLMNGKWKDKFNEYPFLPFGIIIVALCVLGILARIVMWIF
ncbi:MAG: hypothetical protein MJ097_04730 [Dorea sp.]|nr:hypothetical protein [Dorea sp.]